MPFAMKNGYLATGKHDYVHVAVVEKALGHKIPKGCEIHHVNENKLDSSSENLVLCPSHAYHALLHRRMKSFEATGDFNMRKCHYCKDWDKENNLVHDKDGRRVKHRACYNAHMRVQKLARKKKAMI